MDDNPDRRGCFEFFRGASIVQNTCRVLVLLFPCVFVALAGAQNTEPGYTALFNGTDLTGWRYGKGEVLHKQTETPDRRFYVSDGVIVNAAKDRNGNRGPQTLWTVREFAKDFTVSLEFKAANESTASVHVRNAPFGVADFARRGETKVKFQTDGWNELVITVKLHGQVNGKTFSGDDRFELDYRSGKPVAKLNGQEITSVPLSLVIHTVASGRLNGQAHGGHTVGAKGFIGLSTGTGKMEYRNIRFREF